MKRDEREKNSIKYYLSPSKTTPTVTIQNDTFSISGRSSPENAQAFYEPLITKAKSTLADSTFQVDLNLTYINTSSSKHLFVLLNQLGDDKDRMKVVWNYEEDDEDMLEMGEDFSDMLGIPFEFKETRFED